MKILYVEDDEQTRWICVSILTSLGHEVTQADNANAAWLLLETEKVDFDCLILDKNMPNGSGLELIRAIRGSVWHTELPAIMLSAEGGNTSVMESIEGGVNLYLTKPATKAQLGAALEKIQSDVKKRKALTYRYEQLVEGIFNLNSGLFKFQTPSQAKSVALLLSQIAPQPDRVFLGLFEIFINSIEHGNLQIEPDRKNQAIQEGRYREELELLARQYPYNSRWVQVECISDCEFCTLRVSDEGSGFNWRTQVGQCSAPSILGEMHGLHRAMNAGFHQLDYEEDGRVAVISFRTAFRDHRLSEDNEPSSIYLNQDEALFSGEE